MFCNNLCPKITLQNVDAVAFLESLPKYSVDCIITDPPWGVNFVSSSVSGEACFNDDSEYVKELAFRCCREFSRILKPGGHVYIITAQQDLWWHFYSHIFLHFNNLLSFHSYSKNPRIGFDFGSQPVIFASAGLPRPFVSVPRNLTSLRSFSSINIPRSFNDGLHPCLKNSDVLQDFVRWSCPPGGVVLDCFAGGGSTIEACLKTGRRFVGCELNEDYFLKLKSNYIDN